MRFSTPVFAASLLVVAHAAPLTLNPDAEVKSTLEARDHISKCGSSTFTNNSSGASPKISDCKVIIKNINGGGTWTTEDGSQRQLVQFGTCAFGVTGTGRGSFEVGNGDIIDLINSSINKFGINGIVGASGTMHCQGYEFGSSVKWGLYHN